MLQVKCKNAKKYSIYNKKLINNINEICYQLKEWLIGIVEDDPVPYETNILFFAFSINNGITDLSFSAGEHMFNVNETLDYFPLEAQFFNFEPFYNFYKNHMCYKTSKVNEKIKSRFCKTLICNILSKIICDNFVIFAGKKIVVGELGESFKKCIIIQRNK